MAQNFPKDRFDVAPSDLERVGAHRAPERGGRGLRWLLWCLIAVVVVVGAGWLFLHVLDNGSSGGSDNSGGSSSSAPSQGAASGSGSPSTSPSSTPTPSDVPTVVAGTTITVLNGTNTAGLAAGAVIRLSNAGFTAASSGNAPTHDIVTTTVYYSDASLKGVALGVAQALGVQTVAEAAQAADAGVQIAVVLGSDYQP